MPSRSMVFVISLLMFALLLATPTVQATGCWYLPSTVCQYFGYGHGPGYHAPMIRTAGYHPRKVPRTIAMPTGGFNPFCYQNAGPIGCNQCAGACAPSSAAFPAEPILDQNMSPQPVGTDWQTPRSTSRLPAPAMTAPIVPNQRYRPTTPASEPTQIFLPPMP